MNGQYEVLNPWAEVDPLQLRGMSAPRLADLTGKTIGLYAATYKLASKPILSVVKEKLKERFPTLEFSWFEFGTTGEVAETKEKSVFDKWIKGVDAVVAAVGD